MASKTDIANRALSKLGADRVSNIDTDNTKPAKVIRYMWDSVRDAFIAAYPWTFAISRAQLAKDATAPAWGYDNRYRVPSDLLNLLEVKDVDDYMIEGSYILTNASGPIYIRYISRITNTGDFSALFNEAFATRLAFEGCEEITQSNTKKQLLDGELRRNIKEAYLNDAIQELPRDVQPTSWQLSREMWSDDIDYND